MGLDVHAFLVIGLPLDKQKIYQKEVCCESCRKQHQSSFCPDCGGQVKEREVLKPAFQQLIESSDGSMQSTGSGSQEWYLALRKYDTISHRNGHDAKMISVQDFSIPQQEMQDFETKAQKLSVWDKNKFGVYLFQYFSY